MVEQGIDIAVIASAFKISIDEAKNIVNSK
jgi:hypothetical protein